MQGHGMDMDQACSVSGAESVFDTRAALARRSKTGRSPGCVGGVSVGVLQYRPLARAPKIPGPVDFPGISSDVALRSVAFRALNSKVARCVAAHH